MDTERKCDWNEVVALKPQGYLELNDGKRAVHGPVESVTVDELDYVLIRLKWRAEVALGEFGIPQGKWKAVPNDMPTIFPNFVVSYVIQDTPDKGPRIFFGPGANILYINQQQGLDPACVEGLDQTSID